METEIADLAQREPLYEGRSTILYRLESGKPGKRMVLKLLRPGHSATQEIEELANEGEIARSLDVPGVRRAYEISAVQGTPALLLEYVEGTTLRQAFVEQRRGLVEILSVAVSIAKALEGLHRHGIVHRNLSSTNILVGPTGEATLIDLGLATRRDESAAGREGRDVVDGSVEYLSPEQTGAIPRPVDARADLYAFGVVLFEMLAGRLPFEGATAIELVHKHLAAPPPALGELRPDLPAPLPEIVATLLRKDAEDRYPSARALRADLELCLRKLVGTGRIEPFPLAREDPERALRQPRRLHGRERELGELLDAVEQASRGAGGAVLLTGPAGVGKSALAAELRGRVVARGGTFLAGQHEAHPRAMPYHAFLQALGEWIDSLLALGTGELEAWKERISGAVGSRGALLVEALPRLALVLGEQAERRRPEPAQAEPDFRGALLGLFGVLAQSTRPLVLFLDNLQWADGASLELVEELLESEQHGSLLLVAALREEEGASAEAMMALLAAVLSKASVRPLRLANLPLDALNLLIADLLRSGPSETGALAEVVLEKTQGNPLFSMQLLQAAHQQGLLSFDYDERRWTWDLERIRGLGLSANVVAGMKRALERLPEQTRELLSLAACIGTTFDLELLGSLAELPPAKALAALWSAVEEGLVHPVQPLGAEPREQRFELSHDQVRQAAYALLPKKRRKLAHLQIGRLLLLRSPPGEMAENAFVLAGHFNEGFQYLSDEAERLLVIELDLEAGRKARREAAYGAAIWYLSMGTGMLGADRWLRYHDLTIELYLESIEAELQSADYPRAELLCTELLPQVGDPLVLARVHELWGLALTAQDRDAEAIEAGLRGLEVLGIRLPPDPEGARARAAELGATLAERSQSLEGLRDLPEMREASELAAMRILMRLATPAWRMGSELLPVIALEMVARSLSHGASPMAAVACGWHAALLCRDPAQIEQGLRIGRLSLELLERFPGSGLEARVQWLFNVFVRHWQEHARETLRPLLEAARSGTEAGDLEHASADVFYWCAHRIFLGGTLEPTEQRLDQLVEDAQRRRQPFFGALGKTLRQTLSELERRPEGRPPGESLLGLEAARQLIEEHRFAQAHLTLWCRTNLSCLFGRYQEAIEAARLADSCADGGKGSLPFVSLQLFEALALLGQCRSVDEETKHAHLARVAAIRDRMQAWARLSPANHLHELELIEAEIARQAGNVLGAMEHYDNAVRGARAQGFLHEEALAYELQGELFLKLGRTDFAVLCIRNAAERYRLWGARRKADELEAQHADLLAPERQPSLHTAAIVRASHMLSREVRLDSLLDKMMRLVMENAGAEKAVLLESHEGRLVIQACAAIGTAGVQTMLELPVEQSRELPLSVLNFVARTQSPIVSDDAFHDSAHALDPVITERRTKSLLCLPLVHQGKLVGLLYLENNLAAGVFTTEKLELLSTLSSQAAISMENAGLYSVLEKQVEELKRTEAELERNRLHLEEMVEQRTAQLAATNAELEAFVYSISHDLRAPLRSIDGFSLAVLEDYGPQLDAVGQDYLRRVRAATQRMGLLIDDLLRLSRVTRTEMRLAQVDLSALAEIVLAEQREREPGRKVEAAVEPGLTVEGDSNLLRIALDNLLGNAWKFTGKRPIGHIEFGAMQRDGERVFFVRDNGAGFDPTYQNKLFQPFQRLHTEKEFPGTGIGLAIVKRVIARHGGRVWAESRPGEGATFFFTLGEQAA